MPNSIAIFSTDWLNQMLEGQGGWHEHSSNITASCQTKLTCRTRKPEKAATTLNCSQTTSRPVRNGEVFRMEKGQEAHLGQSVYLVALNWHLYYPHPPPQPHTQTIFVLQIVAQCVLKTIYTHWDCLCP